MSREVEINIPMFIGIILLVGVMTAGLVYGIQIIYDLRDDNNNNIYTEVEDLQNIFDYIEDRENNEIITNSEFVVNEDVKKENDENIIINK